MKKEACSTTFVLHGITFMGTYNVGDSRWFQVLEKGFMRVFRPIYETNASITHLVLRIPVLSLLTPSQA
jgi:hypothetical protein